jgi:hypothetical protein
VNIIVACGTSDRSVHVLEGLGNKILHETCNFRIRSTCPVHLFLLVFHLNNLVPSTAWYSKFCASVGYSQHKSCVHLPPYHSPHTPSVLDT